MPSERKIEGILMPMPVAFKQDGAIDHKATDAIIDFYLDTGVHGFFPLGTHGQGMVMEIDERKESRGTNRSTSEGPRAHSDAYRHSQYTFFHRARQACCQPWRRRRRRCAALLLPTRRLGSLRALQGDCPFYTRHADVHLRQYRNPWVEITPAKANRIIEEITPNPLAGIKVSFIPYDKLLGYVYQLPKSVGVFPGGIFNLYTGYSVGVRGAFTRLPRRFLRPA